MAVVDRVVDGVVTVTGTTFEQQLVLETGSGPLRLHASAADSAALVAAAATEVSVRGSDEGAALRVRNFMVTRVGAAPVVDGVIRRDGDRLVLEASGGRLVMGNPPTAFWQLIGARVWVQGPLDTGPNAYGVIRR
jgi:hypothetical protein